MTPQSEHFQLLIFFLFISFRPLLIINAVDESSSSEESISNQPSNIITAPSKPTIAEIIEEPTKKTVLSNNQTVVVVSSEETGTILENNTNNNNVTIITTNQKEDENTKVIQQQNGTESVNKYDFNLIKIVTDFILNEKKFAENCRKINYENKNKLRERIILGIEHVDEKVIEKKLTLKSLEGKSSPAKDKTITSSTEEVKGKTFFVVSDRESLCFLETFNL